MFDVLLIGTGVHLLAIIGLLFRIWWTRDCSGLSAKTQCLYALALTSKYIDFIFYVHYVSLENTVLKIVFIAVSYAIVLSILYFFKGTYEKRYDTTRVSRLILPIVVCFIWIELDSYWDMLWVLGVSLETVAMIPQFHFISESMQIHPYILVYMVAMSTYVALYIINCAFNFYEPSHQSDSITFVSRILQFIFYCDFFLRISPWLLYRRDKRRLEAAAVVMEGDNETPEAV